MLHSQLAIWVCQYKFPALQTKHQPGPRPHNRPAIGPHRVTPHEPTTACATNRSALHTAYPLHCLGYPTPAASRDPRPPRHPILIEQFFARPALGTSIPKRAPSAQDPHPQTGASPHPSSSSSSPAPFSPFPLPLNLFTHLFICSLNSPPFLLLCPIVSYAGKTFPARCCAVVGSLFINESRQDRIGIEHTAECTGQVSGEGKKERGWYFNITIV